VNAQDDAPESVLLAMEDDPELPDCVAAAWDVHYDPPACSPPDEFCDALSDASEVSWHWIKKNDGTAWPRGWRCLKWDVAGDAENGGAWWVDGEGFTSAEEMAEAGWSYHSPAYPPGVDVQGKIRE
jgi:hypothetical protein